MTLAKNLLVQLSYHAKIHNLLNEFEAGITPNEKTHYKKLQELDKLTKIKTIVNRMLETVDKKILEKPKPQLINIKKELILIKENIKNL